MEDKRIGGLHPDTLKDAQRVHGELNAHRTPKPSTPSEEKGWARFSLSFLNETTPESVGNRLHSLEGLIVRLTHNSNTGRVTQIVDVQVLDSHAEWEDDDDGDSYGIEVVEVDEDAMPLMRAGVSRPFLVRYEDIIDIGIY